MTEWRDVKGLEEFFKINRIGDVVRKERLGVDVFGRRKVYRECLLKKQNEGKSHHLSVEGKVRSVSVNSLIRENFPESKNVVVSIDGEIWSIVKGFGGLYSVSNLGRVKSPKDCNGMGAVAFFWKRQSLSKEKTMMAILLST